MWDHVSEDMRRRLLTSNNKDGEFWMSFDDYFKEFEEISICAIGPDFDNDGEVDRVGKVIYFCLQGKRLEGFFICKIKTL